MSLTTPFPLSSTYPMTASDRGLKKIKVMKASSNYNRSNLDLIVMKASSNYNRPNLYLIESN